MPNQCELPKQFQELAPFLNWALPTERGRSSKRHGSSIIEIRAFYDAMVARLTEILTFLNNFAPEEVPADVNRLFLLTLSLAEIAPSVENFGQPGVIDGYDYSRFIPLHD